MTPIRYQPDEEFSEVYQYYDIDRLRVDLSVVNGGDGLSPREEQCLRGIMLDLSPHEIAKKCYCEPSTVRQYLKKPYQLIKLLYNFPEERITARKIRFLLLRDYGLIDKSLNSITFTKPNISHNRQNEHSIVSSANSILPKVGYEIQQQLEEFRRYCELEEYIEAFYTLFNKEDYEGSLSNILDIQGQYNLRVDLLEQLLKSWQPRKTEKWEFGVSLASLGNAYRDSHNYQKAIDCYQQSLTIAEENNDYNTEAGSLLDIGLLFFMEGNPEALKYTRSGLYIARQIGNKYFESYALNNLGLILSSVGEYYKAIDYHHHSLEISINISDYIGQASALFNLGRNHCLLGEHIKDFGEYRHALRFLQRSVEIAHQIGASQREIDAQSELALTWYSMALILEMLNQVSDAINSYKRAYEIFHAIGLNANAKCANDAIQRLSELSIDT